MKVSHGFLLFMVSTLAILSVFGQSQSMASALSDRLAVCHPQINGRNCKQVPTPLLLPGLGMLGAGLLYRKLSHKSN